MELFSLTLNGYRRFATSTALRLDGKLVALLGPNESGKSTILEAIHRITAPSAFLRSGPDQNLTRDLDVPDDQIVLSARFRIDNSDSAALNGIPGGEDVRWLIASQRAADSRFTFAVEPRPQRDLPRRSHLAERLADAIEETEGVLSEYIADPERLLEVRSVGQQLSSTSDNLSAPAIESLRRLSDKLRAFALDSKEEPTLASDLAQLAAEEAEEHPAQRASKLLSRRVPHIARFSEEVRQLAPDYPVDAFLKPSPALRNLAALAALDLARLHALIKENNHGALATELHRANDVLAASLQAAWSQSGIGVYLRVDSGRLFILVGTGDEGDPFVSIAERSEGLRHFLALLSFCSVTAEGKDTILLVDEAELHLHYDAQADLVQMFARQGVASKVIYTTHSAGCLPEDLGNGIRIIEPMAGNRSIVRNWFWDSSEPGLLPIMIGMGARTLAFLTVRFALVGEGATDHILLPSMFREVTGKKSIGFQVVPGLAGTEPQLVSVLDRQATRTLYLVDADKGGVTLTRRLIKMGIPKGRIFALPKGGRSGAVIEDAIAEDLYGRVLSKQVRLFNPGVAVPPLPSLDTANRPSAVEAWCTTNGLVPPSKRSMACGVLEEESGGLVSEDFRASLASLYQRIVAQFQKAGTP